MSRLKWSEWQLTASAPCRWPENMAHTRQSGPDFGVGFQVKVLKLSSRSLFAGKRTDALPASDLLLLY